MDLWALDEVRFEQHGSACRMWVAPEIKDPVLLHHPTRKGIGYFGAVRIRDGKFVYRSNRFTGARAGRGGPQIKLDAFNGNIRINAR